ncbi:SDR family NAD(P)-dependent oxidoreductase [Streptomyces sp. L7]
MLPHLRARGSGHIIQVSSIGGVVSLPGLGLYHASKFALEGFTASLAAEVRGLRHQGHPGRARRLMPRDGPSPPRY